MSLKNLLSDLEKFVKHGQTPDRGHEFDKIDRMQRREFTRRPPKLRVGKRPTTQDPRYYRRPRS